MLERVKQSREAAVFVGSYRRPEAVVVSAERYEALAEAAERQRAVASALASVRADGLEPSAEDLELFVAVAVGELSTEELRGLDTTSTGCASIRRVIQARASQA